MSEHLTELELAAFFAGHLTGSEAARVENHLDTCDRCRLGAEHVTAVPTAVRATVLATARSRPVPDGRVNLPVIPGYTDLHEVGRGGCGIVYRARSNDTGEEVALKVLRDGWLAAPSEYAWLRREAQTAAALIHPNIVAVHAVSGPNELPYYAMEFVPGGPLSKRFGARPCPPAEAARLLEAVARGVHFAHTHGVVHRDLKPSNILLTGDAGGGFGVPKVADFGLAKRLSDAAPFTPSHAVLGTPDYMAPEVAFGHARAAGPAADVYSLGCILYELLVGRPPFRGPTPFDTLMRVRGELPVPPRRVRSDLPSALDAVCMTCLAKAPADRYESAEAFADDLVRFLAGEPVIARSPARPRWCRRRLVACVLAVAALAPVLWSVLPLSQEPPSGTNEPAEPAFEPLFNGTDLSGWEVDGNPGWEVRNGAIVTAPGRPGRGWLYTRREFRDYEMRLQFALTRNANTGVAVRGTPGGGGGNRTVLEVQVRDDSTARLGDKTGSVFINGPDFIPPTTPAPLRPLGDWNDLRLEARGAALSVWVNGALLHRVDLTSLGPTATSNVYEKWFGEANLRRHRGRIGLQYAPLAVRFRAIEVRELSAPG